MDQNLIEQYSCFNDQKYFLQVPESNELTSGFGSQSSRISIDGDSLDNSCDSLSIPQPVEERPASATHHDEAELKTKNVGNSVPSQMAGGGTQDRINCLSENHFYNLFQHHYHLMAHIHRCFLQQSHLRDAECCQLMKEPSSCQIKQPSLSGPNGVYRKFENYLDENMNSYSMVSTNSSGFVDFNHISDGLEEVFTEKLSCDSQFSSISAPFDNRNQSKSVEKPEKILCPVCNYKYLSRGSVTKDGHKSKKGPHSILKKKEEVSEEENEENHSSQESLVKTSRINVFRDEIHPSRLLSTSLNDSSVYFSDARAPTTSHQRWPSMTKRSKNANILTAVVKPRMKMHFENYPSFQHQMSLGVNQDSSSTTLRNNDPTNNENNDENSRQGSEDSVNENNGENGDQQNENNSKDNNSQKKGKGTKERESIAMNETLANQANNSDSTTALSGAYTDQGTRTCCFCWCCCCSCSCMQMRPNADKKKGISNSQNSQNRADVVQADDKPPTYDEVRLWGESFDSLMQNSSGQRVFREFLRSEYSDENIMFWLACEDLKQEVDSEIVEEKARLIYEDYISILSPKEVSLDSRVREIINGNMIEPSPRTFDEAQLQIYTLMHRDSYPRFLNSKLYKELLQKTKSDSFQ